MNWDEMYDAIKDAEQTINKADEAVRKLAVVMKWRLRSCRLNHTTLRALKIELRGYNLNTSRWKDDS